MGLNVGSLMNALSSKASEIQSKMDSREFDASDAGQLLRMQMEVSNYQQIAGLTTAILSDIKQTAQGIIQKV